MKVRSAIDLDIMRLLTLGEEYAMEAERFTEFSFSPERIAEKAVQAILDPNQQIFIAYEGTEILGFMWVALDQPVWTRDIIAYDLFLYVAKGKRNLFNAKALVTEAEKWAKANGAKAMHTGANSGIFKDRPAKALYGHMGYDEGGLNFYKQL